MNMDEPRLKLFVFQTPRGERWLYTHFHRQSVWLTLEQIAELFCTTSEEITKKLKSIYEFDELKREAVSKLFSIADYKNFCKSDKGKEQTYYNLDVILAIGYQIKAGTATLFRKWADRELKNFQVNQSYQKAYYIYLWQIILNLILACLFAVIIQFFTDLSIRVSLGIAAITLLIGMYNIAFEAIRHDKMYGYKKMNSKGYEIGNPE